MCFKNTVSYSLAKNRRSILIFNERERITWKREDYYLNGVLSSDKTTLAKKYRINLMIILHGCRPTFFAICDYLMEIT